MADKTYYELLGGETGVRELVDRFYDEMDSLEDARHIRSLHKEDLTESRQKLFEYFSGWFGGPQLFVEKYGHPMLRARHLHVQIGAAERDAWLICLARALQSMELPETLVRDLLEKMIPMADHMRNVRQESSDSAEQ